MIDEPSHLDDMSERSREVFRHVVEGYLATGGPVGSRTLSRSMSETVSAATIRNVMQDLELMGLLLHELGKVFFVHLEIRRGLVLLRRHLGIVKYRSSKEANTFSSTKLSWRTRNKVECVVLSRLVRNQPTVSSDSVPSHDRDLDEHVVDQYDESYRN